MLEVRQHSLAEDFLSAVFPHLKDEEASANIVLAHAWSLRTTSPGRLVRGDIQAHVGGLQEPSSFWITVWKHSNQKMEGAFLSLVLSCVCGELGNYPVFLWMPRNRPFLLEGGMDAVIKAAATQFISLATPRRVFSVFGERSVVKAFETVWTTLTGFRKVPDPYYHAVLGVCTAESIHILQDDLPAYDTIRLANDDDKDVVALMCKKFSETSHFPLTTERAMIESGLLISRKQLFVYESKGRIVSFCATTRATENVAAVTKVFTLNKSRNQGFAERLVRYATNNALTDGGKTAVVLYVGVENSARKIYDRIGFMGLYQKPNVVFEEALELGFIETEKGHW
ncbi:hypothetical protein E1B28_001528 [Marasmius oreades]|uniref:N-acetyltransferase domain-containing protein n=1 Tax=Marasmius oreades TaxID=181124 RepID=A0A9P7V3M4_9AGAR|nr:uncharacterized protein E1B28_001528 [Marasmius oreades]KAG7099710.1 hypothetical protein E1B28_001528 [Marasmius oreades]